MTARVTTLPNDSRPTGRQSDNATAGQVVSGAPVASDSSGNDRADVAIAGTAPNLSVERAMAILSAFDPQHPHLGVNELSRRLELSRSAVSRLLASLEACGYVAQDERTGRFHLGVAALRLGYMYFQTSDLVQRAAPRLAELARSVELHTHLYGLQDGRLFRYMMLPYPTGLGMLMGFHGFAHATAAGKVLLAALPETERDVVLRLRGLPAVTRHTITDPDQLRVHLDQVKRQGFAVDNEENGIGARCVAAPVRAATGQVIAAASVSGQRSRLGDARLSEVRDQLLEAVAHISASLGYGAWSNGP